MIANRNNQRFVKLFCRGTERIMNQKNLKLQLWSKIKINLAYYFVQWYSSLFRVWWKNTKKLVVLFLVVPKNSQLSREGEPFYRQFYYHIMMWAFWSILQKSLISIYLVVNVFTSFLLDIFLSYNFIYLLDIVIYFGIFDKVLSKHFNFFQPF